VKLRSNNTIKLLKRLNDKRKHVTINTATMSLAIVSRRVLVKGSQQQSRLLSSQTTVAIEKLKHVLEDYRQQK
jgi:hypothetical protein